MPAPSLEQRMRRGDPSVWPRWDGQPIAAEQIDAAWAHVFAHRGTPGVPQTVRAYTHFPYCASSCNFCMYWHEVPKRADAYSRHIDFLVRRFDQLRSASQRQTIESAYCGGGTPTAPPVEQLERYFSAFRRTFDVAGEFTVEGHPGVTTVEKLDVLARHGVNRLSMGVQSLNDEVLVRITRRNPSAESIATIVEAARERGIIVNLDLVLGLPDQTLDSFRSDVRAICALGPDFVTLYLYEPTRRLDIAPGETMTYERALTPDLMDAIHERYDTPQPLTPTTRSYRLERRDAADSLRADERTYAQFDATPSHTLALGPGGFGHVFGRFWYREVTAMGNLEADDPRYFGTTLTPTDECRSVVLDAIDRRHPIDPAAMRRVFGVDPSDAFEAAWSEGRSGGALEDVGGGRIVIGNDAPPAVVDAMIDAIVPPLPETREPGGLDPATVELALVATRRDEDHVAAIREALREFREALRIPARGRQICRGVWVGAHDDGSISFHVAARKAPALRVLVYPPDAAGVEGTYARSKRFAIAYGERPDAPLTAAEGVFLDWMRGKMVAASLRPRERTGNP